MLKKRILIKYDKIILYLSQKIGIDLNYFLNSSIWTSLFQIVNLFKSFILSLLFANYVSPEFFGKYSYITSILAFLMIFSIPNIGAAMIQGFTNKKYYTYIEGIKILLKYSLIGTLGIICFGIYNFFISKIEISLILIGLGLLFPLYSISTYFQTYYLGKKKFKEYAVLNSISLIITLLLTSIILLTTKNLILTIIIPIIFKLIFESYLTLIHIMKKIKNNKIDLESVKHAKQTYLTNAFYLGSTRLEPILIGLFVGTKELAIFTLITLIPNQGITLFNFVTPTFLPKLTEQINKINKFNIFKHLLKLEIIFIIVFISYFICADFIFNIFYNTYSEYTYLSKLFALILLTIPQMLIYIYFRTKLKTRNLNIINISTLIISMVIIYPTIIFSTFQNLIYAKLIQNYIIFIISIILLIKEK